MGEPVDPHENASILIASTRSRSHTRLRRSPPSCCQRPNPGLRPGCLAAGVPEFFRWLVERYPLIYEAGTRVRCPDTDYLYVDLRGMVHACGREARRTDPEDEFFPKVYEHLDRLVHLVQPTSAVYLAVDGEWAGAAPG